MITVDESLKNNETVLRYYKKHFPILLTYSPSPGLRVIVFREHTTITRTQLDQSFLAFKIINHVGYPHIIISINYGLPYGSQVNLLPDQLIKRTADLISGIK